MKTVLQERMSSFDNLFAQHTAASKQVAKMEQEGDTKSQRYVKETEKRDSFRRKLLALSPTAQKTYDLAMFDDPAIYKIANNIRDALLNDEAEGLLKSSIDMITDFDDMYEEIEVEVIDSITYKDTPLTDDEGNEQVLRIPEIKTKKQTYIGLKPDGKIESTVSRFKRGVASIANTLKLEELTVGAEPEIDLAVIEQSIAKLLQSDKGTDMILSIVSKQHYINIANNYLESYYQKHVKVENNQTIPLDDAGKQLLLSVEAFDDKQNKIVTKSLWSAICDHAFEDLSKKYAENSLYYNGNSTGTNNGINEQFIQTLTECMNLASSKLVLRNQNFAKELLYLSLPNNPYSQPKQEYNPVNIFQDPLKVTNLLQGGVNPNSMFEQQPSNRVLSQQEQIQLAYNLQNQINTNPTLVNRDPGTAYNPQTAIDSLNSDFARLGNTIPQPQLTEDVKITF